MPIEIGIIARGNKDHGNSCQLSGQAPLNAA